MTTSFGDTGRARLRTIVETLENDLARPGEAASTELRATFAELVTALALGPAPELRACPVCFQFGMRNASRCGHCWAKLAPLPANDVEPTAAAPPA